ncbi:MAG: flagellar basal body P-ring formation chaperone FlgA [Planctomycetota bacterium]
MLPIPAILSGILFLAAAQDREDAEEPAAARATIDVRRSAQVPGTRILLGDVAEVTSGDAELAAGLRALDLGATPTSRWARWVDRAVLERAIRASGVDLARVEWKGRDKVEVYAALELVDDDELVKAAETALRALLHDQGEKDAAWTLTVRPRTIEVPRAREARKLLPRLTDPELGHAMARFSVDVEVDGEVVRRVQLGFRLQRYRQVLTVRRALASGADFDAEHCAVQRVDIAAQALPGDAAPLTRLEQCRGRVAARNLTPGTVLFESDLTKPSIIAKGETVTVIAQVGRIRITTQGQAQQAGGLGDRIPVVVEREKRKLSVEGRVVGTGTVVVEARR